MLEKVSYEPIEKLKRIIRTYQLDKYKSYAKPDVDSMSNSISDLILQRQNYKIYLLVHTGDLELDSGRSTALFSLFEMIFYIFEKVKIMRNQLSLRSKCFSLLELF